MEAREVYCAGRCGTLLCVSGSRAPFVMGWCALADGRRLEHWFCRVGENREARGGNNAETVGRWSGGAPFSTAGAPTGSPGLKRASVVAGSSHRRSIATNDARSLTAAR
jgi:hypothetical protein